VALRGGGVWALVVQQLSYQLSNCLVLAVQLRWCPKMAFDVRRARELFAFGWKLLASGLLETGYQSLSDLIVGAQFTKADLGMFSQGKKYPQAVGTILDGSVQPVMLSAISRVQDDRAAVKRLTRRAIKTSTFVVVPAMATFAVVAEPLVRLLLGEKWLPCVPFLQVYCLVYAFLPVHTTNLQALNGTGHSDLFLKLEVIKKVYGAALLFLGAFVFRSPLAIALGSLVGSLVSTFVNAYPNTRVIGYSFGEQVRDYAPAFGLAAAAGAVAWSVRMLGMGDLATLGLQIAAMVVAYLLLAWILRVEEFQYLLRNAHALVASRL
jgi:O-antigen/teichoic acid export membrane protein